ncbi:hypothetical protein [Pelagicoccus sp. SDUM812002]|uniref:hypothetical protein n=1 Tax=Pelagicoccus sp. SDUM812002 TaxID=3041266 RepID=UPI00280E6589|nr:hypothetical protein [Pelagicoccus sp. SDUM812002]MDQ8188284.1 hypothetical protein [Pelagicoccus sp. SDUM812002]
MRLSATAVASVALVLFSLFPNLHRLAGQFSRVLHPERLVDPFFLGSDEALAELEREIPILPHDAPLSQRVDAVHAFVKKRITYESDWNLFGGNLHDWPTAAEVWQRKSDDCDGIAIVGASLLNRIGISATLEYNAFHCWIKVTESTGGESQSSYRVGGAVAGPTGSKADGSVDWIRLAQGLLAPRTWTEGLSFPLWRLCLTLLAGLAPWTLFLTQRPIEKCATHASVLYQFSDHCRVGDPQVSVGSMTVNLDEELVVPFVQKDLSVCDFSGFRTRRHDRIG